MFGFMVFVFCISYVGDKVTAATGLIPPAVKPSKFAYDIGCYLKDYDRMLQYKKPFSPRDGVSCVQYTCDYDGYISIFTCVKQVVLDKSCVVTPGDMRLGYPGCCTNVHCKTTNNNFEYSTEVLRSAEEIESKEEIAYKKPNRETSPVKDVIIKFHNDKKLSPPYNKRVAKSVPIDTPDNVIKTTKESGSNEKSNKSEKSEKSETSEKSESKNISKENNTIETQLYEKTSTENPLPKNTTTESISTQTNEPLEDASNDMAKPTEAVLTKPVETSKNKTEIVTTKPEYEKVTEKAVVKEDKLKN